MAEKQKGKDKAAAEVKEDGGWWQVQLVEDGSAGAGKEMCVRSGLWKQHHPIIMGSMGESLLSIEPAALAGAFARADVLGVPAAAGGG